MAEAERLGFFRYFRKAPFMGPSYRDAEMGVYTDYSSVVPQGGPRYEAILERRIAELRAEGKVYGDYREAAVQYEPGRFQAARLAGAMILDGLESLGHLFSRARGASRRNTNPPAPSSPVTPSPDSLPPAA